MSVTAQLDAQVRADPGGEVAGHDRGGATQEGERRTAHPAIPQAHELGEPGLLLPGENLQRIGPVGARRGFGVCLEGNGFQPPATRLTALGRVGLEVGGFVRDVGAWTWHLASRRIGGVEAG
ncbi:MAG: hypothetical protein L6Q83_00480 [Gammaproteobacteria bacterium]|nr:hypothetical protein [Gammaproteobacteria bacterium]